MHLLRQLMNLLETEPAPLVAALELVFVYGSLKRAYGNHRLLGDSTARFLGMAKTAPRFDLLDLGAFPAAIPGKHIVTGEVYEVDEKVMKGLDKLESNGSMYLRKKIPVVLAGKQISAWIYLYMHDDGYDDLVEPQGNTVTW